MASGSAGTATGRRRYQWLLLLVVAGLLAAWAVTGGLRDGATTGPSGDAEVSAGAPAGSATDPASGLPWVDLADLPPEAAETVDLIAAGGPFPEPDRDGSVFENREELLPDQPRGYYREYTVPTPGASDRGARRIVAGDDDELYWTGDHYASFSRIAEDAS